MFGFPQKPAPDGWEQERTHERTARSCEGDSGDGMGSEAFGRSGCVSVNGLNLDEALPPQVAVKQMIVNYQMEVLGALLPPG